MRGGKVRGFPTGGRMWLIAASAALAPAAAAAAPEGATSSSPASPATATFGAEPASSDVRDVANWVTASRDNRGLPFLIVDKIAAKVFLFDRRGTLTGAAPALLGIGRGDRSVPGIGQRKLATITPAERTTPAGRFQASLGRDFEQDILWVDYDAALSLHRVIVGNPKDRRAARLASPTPLDNRISFGCINVPAAFYDTLVAPAFTGTIGIVYILPETQPLRAVFAMPDPALHAAAAGMAGAR
jgi:hypothetical protein